MNFLDCVEINPRVSMQKGKVYPFVDMASVSTSSRKPDTVDEKEYTSGVKFSDGDTVIARIEPCLQNGKRFWAHDIGVGFGSTEFLVFRAIKGIMDEKYLYYFMMTENIKKKMVNSMTGATGRQRVNNDVFKSMEIDLPDLPTQHRIASILSAYDDLIENNRRQIKLLEEAAQRLYREWFVELRFPGHEGVKIVDGVPEGWKQSPVGSLLQKVPRTKQIMTADYQSEGHIPVVDQSKDFIAGYTDDEEALVSMDNPIIVFGDHTRVLKYITFPFAKGADGTQLLLSNTDSMPQSLLYHSLIHVDLSNYHYARHFKYLKESTVLVPDADIAVKYDKIVDPMMLRIQCLRDQCIQAQKARDLLLPKLMSGEMEV